MDVSVRAAGIDCGTNSIRLLIADVDPEAGTLRSVERLMRIVRLGQGVDATGRLAPEAIARAVATVADYAARCAELGVEEIRMVATSATRDASNASDFSQAIREILGRAPEIADGAEEAALSFAGAATAIVSPHPILAVDLGGGSTELVLGMAPPPHAHDGGAPGVLASFSMDVGCVRMTERHLRSDPPTPAEVAAAASDVDAWLDKAGRVVDLGATRTLVGLAGSVTTLAAFALDLHSYDPLAVHGSVFLVDDMLSACRRMWEMPRAAIAALGTVQVGRADVIAGGALVWSRVIERVRAATRASGHPLSHVTVSEHDILDGITMTAAARAHTRGRSPLP